MRPLTAIMASSASSSPADVIRNQSWLPMPRERHYILNSYCFANSVPETRRKWNEVTSALQALNIQYASDIETLSNGSLRYWISVDYSVADSASLIHGQLFPTRSHFKTP